MRKNKEYKVSGLAVVGRKDNAIMYDLLDSKLEAIKICEILNEGIGPDWDEVGPELERRLDAAKAAR
jgi:hypothetical protein